MRCWCLSSYEEERRRDQDDSNAFLADRVAFFSES